MWHCPHWRKQRCEAVFRIRQYVRKQNGRSSFEERGAAANRDITCLVSRILLRLQACFRQPVLDPQSIFNIGFQTFRQAPTLARIDFQANVVWIELWAPDSFSHRLPRGRCLDVMVDTRSFPHPSSKPTLFGSHCGRPTFSFTDFQANVGWIRLATPTFPPPDFQADIVWTFVVDTDQFFHDFQANAVWMFLSTPDFCQSNSKPTLSGSFCRHPTLSATDFHANVVWNCLSMPDMFYSPISSQKDYQIAISKAGPMAKGAKTYFFRPNEFHIATSKVGPVGMGAKTCFVTSMNLKLQFQSLGQRAWEQKHLFRQNEFQILMSEVGPVGMDAETYLFSPERIAKGNSQGWAIGHGSSDMFFSSEIISKSISEVGPMGLGAKTICLLQE